MENLEIKPNIGFGDITFGATQDEIIKVVGKPEETEKLTEDEDFYAIACNYWDKGFTLFFDGDDNSVFSCVETDNAGATLFGKQIFKLKEKAIIELMQKNGFNDLDTELETWGEKRVSFEDALIDFYFDHDKLVSVNWGVVFDEEEGED
ncbi:MAG: hypothetical protein HXX09_13110 [Bacteroidetes bacterium]|jgi:hypothetical protein|nr:hypothetical protein [Bacteroidota bacterium]